MSGRLLCLGHVNVGGQVDVLGPTLTMFHTNVAFAKLLWLSTPTWFRSTLPWGGTATWTRAMDMDTDMDTDMDKGHGHGHGDKVPNTLIAVHRSSQASQAHLASRWGRRS